MEGCYKYGSQLFPSCTGDWERETDYNFSKLDQGYQWFSNQFKRWKPIKYGFLNLEYSFC